MYAQEEAWHLGQNLVGTEMILLGILGVKTSVAARALQEHGLTREQTRDDVESLIHRGPDTSGKEMPFTPEAKRLMEYSWEIARELNQKEICADHFLLGLIRQSNATESKHEEPCVATKVLRARNVNLDELRATIVNKLERTPPTYESPHFEWERSLFKLFSDEAIKVIMFAQDESRQFRHNFVGTEMILLGLLSDGRTTAGQVLKSVGLTLRQTREDVERIIKRGSGFVRLDLPFTPRCKKLLDLSRTAFEELGHEKLDTAHILLGMIREIESSRENSDPQGVAFQVLQFRNIDIETLKATVVESITK